MYRDHPILAYDGRPSIYHGTGQKVGLGNTRKTQLGYGKYHSTK